jgi:hypothetical protein
MKPKYEKVEGSNYLFRDPNSQAILSADQGTFAAARNAKMLRKKKMQEEQQIKTDVEELKSDMTDIKNLLKALVDKHG